MVLGLWRRLSLELIVFVLCLGFGLVWVLLGLRWWFLGVLGMIFNFSVVVDVFVNGLTDVIGYVGGSVVEVSYGVDVVILLPMFFVVVGAVGLLLGRRRRR